MRPSRLTFPFSGTTFTLLLLALLALLVEPVRSHEAGGETGFRKVAMVSGLRTPTAMAVAPDGRIFLAEKEGRVWLVRNGVRGTVAALDIVDEVHAGGDHGILGITLHPQFNQKPWLYLWYATEQDGVTSMTRDGFNNSSHGRLTRYRVVGDTIDTSSRQVLLGATPATGSAACSTSHGCGALRWGTNGELFLSAGEGGHWDFPDVGQDAILEDAQCLQYFGPAQDIGSFRAQSLESLSGKILRVDPETGLGLPDNPFFDGNPDSLRSRIFARGLRNPFRFAIDPVRGGCVIADVGLTQWEEINRTSPTGGENFGWPCRDAQYANDFYTSDTLAAPLCAALAGDRVTTPILAISHGDESILGFTAASVTGVQFYFGSEYPEEYDGALFFAEFVRGWIRALKFNDRGEVVSILPVRDDFTTIVDLGADPLTGEILALSIGGTLYRITYTGGKTNSPPELVATATAAASFPSLQYRFSSDGTDDPDGDRLPRFLWNFGDGNTSDHANVIHTYALPGIYQASFTAWDDRGLSATLGLEVRATEPPFTVKIVSPPDRSAVEDSLPTPLIASIGAPALADTSATLAYEWTVDILHNDHIHPRQFITADPSPGFTFPQHGIPTESVMYRVNVTVRGPGGYTAGDSVIVWPKPNDQTPANLPPKASFLLTPRDALIPHLAEFDGRLSVDPNQNPMTWKWNFGDGWASEGSRTTHIYTIPGVYDVRLDLLDPYGASDTVTSRIVVRDNPLDLNLEGYWRFDEPPISLAIDESGWANYGFPTGVFRATRNPGRQTPTYPGQGALWIESDDEITSAQLLINSTAGLTLTGDGTWCALVYPKSTGATPGQEFRPRAILSKRLPIWFAEEYELRYIPETRNVMFLGSGIDVRRTTAQNSVPPDRWTHIAVTLAGNQLTLYINGRLSVMASADPTVPNDLPLLIGATYDRAARNWLGGIDEVRLYGRALTAEEIRLVALDALEGEAATQLRLR